MGKTTLAILFTLAGSAFAAKLPPPPKVLSADQILLKADEAKTPTGDFSAQVIVADWKDKAKLRETVYRVSTKNNQRALIETVAPIRLQGRKILLRDNDLWLYLPSLKRATRVSLQQRLTGEVANGDIARANFHEDYEPRLVGTIPFEGKPHFKLELKAKHKDVTYHKLHLWVDTATYFPRKAEFFAISGKLLKSSEYSEFEPVLGVKRATKIVIRDALTPTRYSSMKYSNYKREKLDDSFFSKESLP